jgi:hypothetical protein
MMTACQSAIVFLGGEAGFVLRIFYICGGLPLLEAAELEVGAVECAGLGGAGSADFGKEAGVGLEVLEIEVIEEGVGGSGFDTVEAADAPGGGCHGVYAGGLGGGGWL